jgi:hypothetical protein
MGGMIAGRTEKRLFRVSTIADTVYYRADFDSDPCQITVPNLTRKERVYLDREMPGTAGRVPKEFDLGSEATERYREIYRFLPAFAEIPL